MPSSSSKALDKSCSQDHNSKSLLAAANKTPKVNKNPQLDKKLTPMKS